MPNIFDKYKKSIRKKYKISKGNFKRLNNYKTKLVEEVKKLKQEKKDLIAEIKKSKKQTEQINDLSDSIKKLKSEKELLEVEIARLYKAKELTIDLKELTKNQSALKEEVKDLEEQKNQLLNDINDLKGQKAILIDEIENQNTKKYYLKEEEHFSIEYVDKLEGLEFERYFGELLDKLGFYDIKVTNSSGDFGIDVIAKSEDILYGFQCKLYSEDVGNKAIQEAFSGKEHYKCNIAVVVTNRFFTPQAIQQAKETNVILWDRTILINKLKQASKMDFNINI